VDIMTDGNELVVINQPDRQKPTIIYALYLASLVFGVTSLIGVIMAYVTRDEASTGLRSHYQFLIRTFWISILFGLIPFGLAFFLIGFLTGLLTAIWFIMRCVKGLSWLGKGQAVPAPEFWLFGEASQ